MYRGDRKSWSYKNFKEDHKNVFYLKNVKSTTMYLVLTLVGYFVNQFRGNLRKPELYK